MSEDNPIRSVVFLYAANFGGMLLGLLYWVLMARISTPDVIGTASVAMSVIAITLSLADLGVAVGVQRFLGKAVAEKNYTRFELYLKHVLLILLVSTSAAVTTIILLSDFLWNTYGIPYALVLLIGAVVLVANFLPPFYSALTASLRTGYLAVSSFLSGIVKISVGFVLVILGLEYMGIIYGILAMYLTFLCLCMYFTGSLRRKMEWRITPQDTCDTHAVEVIKAGMPTYIPGTIQTVGSQLGVLLVFGYASAQSTGFYYVSLQMFAVIILIPSSIMAMLFPYISGRSIDKERLVQLGIRFAYILTIPIISVIILYPSIPLGIMGNDYTSASGILQILAASVPFFTISVGVSTLAYASGRYRIVLGIGLATNLARIILYVVFTPLYSAIGAATAFFLGSVIGFIAALIGARKLDLELERRKLSLVTISAIVVSAVLWILEAPWLVGTLLVFVILGVFYARASLVTREEIEGVVDSAVPGFILYKYDAYIRKILKLIYGE